MQHSKLMFKSQCYSLIISYVPMPVDVGQIICGPWKFKLADFGLLIAQFKKAFGEGGERRGKRRGRKGLGTVEREDGEKGKDVKE